MVTTMPEIPLTEGLDIVHSSLVGLCQVGVCMCKDIPCTHRTESEPYEQQVVRSKDQPESGQNP